MFTLKDLIVIIKDGTYQIACEKANTVYQMSVTDGKLDFFIVNGKKLIDQLIQSCLLDCEVVTVIMKRIYITK